MCVLAPTVYSSARVCFSQAAVTLDCAYQGRAGSEAFAVCLGTSWASLWTRSSDANGKRGIFAALSIFPSPNTELGYGLPIFSIPFLRTLQRYSQRLVLA